MQIFHLICLFLLIFTSSSGKHNAKRLVDRYLNFVRGARSYGESVSTESEPKDSKDKKAVDSKLETNSLSESEADITSIDNPEIGDEVNKTQYNTANSKSMSPEYNDHENLKSSNMVLSDKIPQGNDFGEIKNRGEELKNNTKLRYGKKIKKRKQAHCVCPKEESDSDYEYEYTNSQQELDNGKQNYGNKGGQNYRYDEQNSNFNQEGSKIPQIPPANQGATNMGNIKNVMKTGIMSSQWNFHQLKNIVTGRNKKQEKKENRLCVLNSFNEYCIGQEIGTKNMNKKPSSKQQLKMKRFSAKDVEKSVKALEKRIKTEIKKELAKLTS